MSRESLNVVEPSELVVLSHLRWDWVWQRPQHLISRLAGNRPTFFVEEPRPTEVDEPTLRTVTEGAVTRVFLEVPARRGEKPQAHFTDPRAASYGQRLRAVLGSRERRAVWLYTPMALDLAAALEPDVLVYDVMDDLASFANAPAELELRQHRVLRDADLVFTGGRSLHAGVTAVRPDGVHLFPSGVEPEHYATALDQRVPKRRPVAGYVGVVDERLDLHLIAGLADALPDWDVHFVGPVAKIEPDALPQRPNLHWVGARSYDELPGVMAGFDVALMPFALNDSTRSISPTKTLEYLAAGLPVVSTRVTDVVTDYGEVVDLQDDAAGFADACRRVLRHDAAQRARRALPHLRRQHWDTIAAGMDRLLCACFETSLASEESA
jgi:glycosyltransferase involved in cell wall biosynthesis